MTNAVEIVMVEDNDDDAELIMRTLKKHNLANQVVRLRDGAEAVEFLLGVGATVPSGTPRVILLDVKLPKLDGMEVLRRLRADDLTKAVPVVMLTSSDQARDIKNAYELGANSFVTKPIHFGDFSKAVADLGLYWMMLNIPPARKAE